MGRWKPHSVEGKTTNVIVSTSADGYLSYWHATTGKCIIAIQDPNKADLYCLDFCKDGSIVAVGAKDYEVKLYDDNTKTLVTTLRATGSRSKGHSNRVFAVRFTEDPNLLVSGGWDNTIFFWDVRESKTIGFIYGPHICGDSMDIRGSTLLTGSYSNKDVLQVWDIPTRKLRSTIPWQNTGTPGSEHGYLYSALFNKGPSPTYLAAGGAGPNEMRVFRYNPEFDLLGQITFGKTVTSIDFANTRNMLAVSCTDGFTRLYVFDDTQKLP